MPGNRWYNTKVGLKVASQFEADVIDWMVDNGKEFEYEAEALPYETPVVNGKCPNCGHEQVVQRRVYTPDIKLANGSFIEIKGKFTPAKRTLMRHLIKAHPDRTFHFVFYNDPFLTKQKARKLSDWARAQGVECHIWNPAGGKKAAQHWLPEEWFDGPDGTS